MLSNYKVIKISRRRKSEKNASYIVQKKDTQIYDQIKVPQNEIFYEIGDYVEKKYIDCLNNEKLYKDYQKINCNEKLVYSSNLKEIADFIQESNNHKDILRKKLLWDKIQKEEQNPEHTSCAGKKKNDLKEKTICRCMYHYNSKNSNKSICNNCSLKPKWRNVSRDVTILEYEYPTTKKYENVGGMDLILEYKNQIYATEIKPENSNETLARMFAEILTYTQDTNMLEKEGFMNGRKANPAICFFEGSKQNKDFKKYKSELEDIMNIICKTISVFIIKKRNEDKEIIDFEIEYLN